MDVFVAGFLLSLSLCLDIGMVNVATVRTGLNHGFKPAFFLGLGSCIGDLTYAVFSIVALSYVLEYIVTRLVLWIGGTGVLLFLSYQMLQESLRVSTFNYDALNRPISVSSNFKSFSQGIGLALASPSAILWFASVGGSVIASYSHKGDALFSFFLGFFVAGVIWSLFVAFICGQGKKVIDSKALQRLSFTSALLFLFFAIKVFFDGYKTFIVQ